MKVGMALVSEDPPLSRRLMDKWLKNALNRQCGTTHCLVQGALSPLLPSMSALRVPLPISWIPPWALVSLAVMVILRLETFIKSRIANPRNLPLPPGPKALPIVGNMFGMPREYEWFTYSDWAKQYGTWI